MASTYTLISSTTVGAGGSASITFSSIPSTYTDLILKLSVRSDRATVQDTFKITFNATASGYSFKRIYGDGTTAASDGSTGDAYLTVGYSVGNTASDSTFGNVELYIPNYAGSYNKSVSTDGTGESNANTAYQGFFTSLWSNTAAITSITIEGGTSATLLQYSSAYLYGIKNS
jgi:hypothetical protein